MTTTLIICFLLALLSLVAVSVVNDRENRRRVVNKKLREMKQRVKDMEELVLELDQLLENKSIARFINDEILAMISAIQQANPDTTHLVANYQTALIRGDALTDQEQDTPLDRLKDSDSQIARSRKVLEETAVILRKQQATGKLEYEQMSAFLTDLSWAHLMVAVISHVGQGHKRVRRGDILGAHAFYKKAQQLAMQSSHPDTRRHRCIKELTEMLTNKRQALSLDIMPESHLNPAPKASTAEQPEQTSTPPL